MIPASHFHDNGDRTAWVVVEAPEGLELAAWGLGDRPCDTPHCNQGHDMRYDDGHSRPCTDCSGTGRHTFTVEVECGCRVGSPYLRSDCICDGGTVTVRVSVVPGMVLPIVSMTEACSDEPNPPQFVIPGGAYGNDVAVGVPDAEHETIITLPPASAPGMFAVKLAVQS